MSAPRMPAATIGRLWTMLANRQGTCSRRYVVYPGREAFSLGAGVVARPLTDVAEEIGRNGSVA